MTTRTDDPTGEVTELLQHLIRNACVNDGTLASGQEVRNADLLASYLEGTGLDLERYEAAPGRVEPRRPDRGQRPSAPSLLLMGHMDVVPVNADGWRHDPFGGELIDGEVWGRGAIDMLNETASMAVAFKRLAQSGFRAEGNARSTSASPTRRRWGPTAPTWMLRARARRRQRRLRDHRIRRVRACRCRRRPAARSSRSWSARRARSGRRSA